MAKTIALIAEPLALSVVPPVLEPYAHDLELAQQLVVATPEQYKACALMLGQLRMRWDRVEKDRKTLKAPVTAAANNIDDWFRPHLIAYEDGAKILQRKLNDYDKEQERLAEQRRLAAEAEAKRVREEADAIRRKVEREAAEARIRQAEQEAAKARAAKEAAEAKTRQERAEREAAEAQAAGDRQRADEATAAAAAAREETIQARIAQRKAENEAATASKNAAAATASGETAAAQLELQADTLESAPIEAEVVQTDGLSRVGVWRWRLKDITKLEPKYLQVNETLINGLVMKLKGGAQSFIGKGIEVYTEYQRRRK